MKIAIYSRYSTDSQNPASIKDQIASCTRLIESKFNIKNCKIIYFSDAAKSGESTVSRYEFENMLTYIRSGQIDIVVAEGLDRISRSLSDTAQTFEIFLYYGTKIITVQEGLISELHVSFKGAMNSLFLKDLRTKVKRGQIARAKLGRLMGKTPYGYDIVRGVVDENNRNINGLRKINPENAKIVKRIYTEYASGKDVIAIAKDLSKDCIKGPRGGKWKPWSFLGEKERMAGILRNEIYNGRIVFNRTKQVKNPETGKIVKILRPVEKWIITEVPHLKIIDDELWKKVRKRDDCAEDKIKAHYRKTRAIVKLKRGNRGKLTHNQNPLTGYVYCGVCGGRKSMGKFKRYICDNNRYLKTCKNGRSANEDEIIKALETLLLNDFKRIKNFREIFSRRQKANFDIKKDLDQQIEALEIKINNLGKGVANGINGYLDLALKLKKEQEKLKNNIKNIGTVIIPSEEEIRYNLSSTVASTFARKNRETTRILIKSTVDKIILLPKKNKKLKENIKIYLQNDCWFNLYKTIVKK